ASLGHVRDMPKSQMGIDFEHDFEPKYITIRGKGELLGKLRKDAKAADKVYLATDPDREGEAISWHLLHALNLGEEKPISRITFNEITKTAVKKSITEARDIDMDLVDAQQARRVLDRVVGYTISDLLWKKVKKGLSGGRVQSVALRLICDREGEIREFIPEEYWTLGAKLKDADGKVFEAKFYGKGETKTELANEAETNEVLDGLKGKDFAVTDVKTGSRQKKPVAPFTTSTMQQEASKHLNMATQKTMMIAQQLYEGVNVKGEGTVGLVSYIRTDSFRISDEAYEAAVAFIKETYGDAFVNPERIVYKSKGKTQDAHEAIRPTNVSRTPESIKDSLSKDQYRLYKLIWERFVASQMSPAVYDTLSVKLSAGDYTFRASGSRLRFSGFLEAYSKGEEEDEKVIPKLTQGDILQAEQLLPEQHFTQPPARYTDASLIKTLEEIGVGRPSTYAPTLTTIQARHYVTKEAKNLFPTELGEMVDEIMKTYFPDIVDIDFTANMEKRLDDVEMGKEEWKQIIRDFYPDFKKSVENAAEKLEKIEIKDEETDIICEKCGRNMVIKYGRYGKFLACPGFPECQNAKPYFEEAGVNCPECGGKVLIKKTKKGRIYYGCEHNGDGCDFMSWNKPTGEKCPECGAFLEEKGRKNPKIVCSNEKCGYMKEKPAEEENEE
ncbi:type I DNA topoisomerase, partial [Anaerotignum faecicola]|uniref:type I DNA topoisomerase n=1 Tax=Anaerotignum faecicola TaxID=2358141 RepID=UPI003FD775B5